MVTVRFCSKLKTSWKSFVFTTKVGKNSRYFVGFFNETIIPLALVGYGINLANPHPTRTRGIIVKYIFLFPDFVFGIYFYRGITAEYTLSLPWNRVHYMVTPNSGSTACYEQAKYKQDGLIFLLFLLSAPSVHTRQDLFARGACGRHGKAVA